jgi:hypothetical protein
VATYGGRRFLGRQIGGTHSVKKGRNCFLRILAVPTQAIGDLKIIQKLGAHNGEGETQTVRTVNVKQRVQRPDRAIVYSKLLKIWYNGPQPLRLSRNSPDKGYCRVAGSYHKERLSEQK